jgi:hypothetical protein
MYSCVIYVWPDGTWCYDDELHEMTYMSDDYVRIEVGPDQTVDEVLRATRY